MVVSYKINAISAYFETKKVQEVQIDTPITLIRVFFLLLVLFSPNMLKLHLFYF